MSRIGRAPVAIPAGVEVSVADGNVVTVKKGNVTLTRTMPQMMTIEVKDGHCTVSRPNDEKQNRALHGLTRSLLNDMVVGVDKGFSKTLKIVGVGYRAQKDGKNLVMNLGYSHQVVMPEVENITIEVPAPDTIVVKGPDKQLVGQFAANVREKRPPIPYKGKGIRYENEVVRIKEGKTGK